MYPPKLSARFLAALANIHKSEHLLTSVKKLRYWIQSMLNWIQSCREPSGLIIKEACDDVHPLNC